MNKTLKLKLALAQREAHLDRLAEAEVLVKAIKDDIRALPFVGKYPLTVKLVTCPCGAGPFSVREFERHICKIKTGKGRWVRGKGLL